MSKIMLMLSFVALFISCGKDDTTSTITTPENSKITEISTLSDYDNTIKSGVSLTFFHATWCSICKSQSPEVDGLTTETTVKTAKLVKVDVDKGKDITTKYKISGQPVIVIYKDNVEKHRLLGGGHTKAKLAELIKALL